MNSYWVPHASSENHCETTKLLKICYIFSVNQEQVYRTKIWMSTNWNDASTTSGPLRITWLLFGADGEWLQHPRTCVCAGGGHFEHTL